MDIKTITKETNYAARRRERKRALMRTTGGMPRGPPTNEMMYLTRWTNSNLSANGSGVISANVCQSIQLSSEYSSISNIFQTVKLVRWKVILSPIQASSSSDAQNALYCGTNWTQNYTTNTAPSNFNAVQNLQGFRTVFSGSVRPISVAGRVPPALEPSIINADAPSTPIPYAGSPGVMAFYGDGFTDSAGYFAVIVEAVYYLKGRF